MLYIGMMHFTKDTTNTFYMTLSERTTISNPFYLFCFFDYATQTLTKTIVQINQSNERYDRILIIEKSNPDTDAGEVRLMGDSGEYKVYQKSGIDYTVTGDPIECGLWKFDYTASVKPKYDNDQERAVYNG